MPNGRLIYISVAVRPMSAPELTAIATRSAEKNAKVDVTGLLVYSRGTFLQLLEGPILSVINVYEMIKKDPRHTSITQLAFGSCNSRLFAEWGMGLVDLTSGVGMSSLPFSSLHAFAKSIESMKAQQSAAPLVAELMRQLSPQSAAA